MQQQSNLNSQIQNNQQERQEAQQPSAVRPQSTVTNLHRITNKEEANCTDVFWLIVFIFIFIGCIGLLGYGAISGNPLFMDRPLDPDHNACGNFNAQNYPYIYFVSPSEGYLYRTVCVSQCPSSSTDEIDCLVNSLVPSCESNSSPDPTKQFLVYPSVQYLQAVCLPTNFQQLEIIAPNLGPPSQVQVSVHNIYMTRPLIYFGFFFTIFLCCLISRCIDRYQFIVVWGFTLFSYFGYLGAAIFFYHQFSFYQSIQISQTQIAQGIPLTQSQAYAWVELQQNNKPQQFTFFVIFTILAFFKLFTMISRRNDVDKLLYGLRSASEFISWNPRIVVISVIAAYIIGGLHILWVNALVGFLSMGQFVDQPNTLPYQSYEQVPIGLILAAIASFLWIWVSVFVIQFVDFVTHSVAVLWYYEYTENRGDRDFLNVVKITIKQHLGTIALQSLLTILLRPVQILLSPITSNEQSIASCMKCSNFCANLFANFMKFYNNWILRDDSTAFSIVYLTNKSFNQSAQEVIQLRAKHKVLAAVQKLGDLFTHRSGTFMGMINLIFAFIIFSLSSYLQLTVMTPVYITLIVALLAYLISQVFMNVFGEAIHSLTCVYIHDRNDSEEGGEARTHKAPLVVKNFVYLVEIMLPSDERNESSPQP